MFWQDVRKKIKGEEERIKEEYGLTIEVYGSGSQGYELLSDCLNRNKYWIEDKEAKAEEIWEGKGKRAKILRKQVHEYWTFLMLVEKLAYGYKIEEREKKFSYQPTRNKDVQRYPKLATPKGTIFIEPCLTGYNRESILSNWGNRLHYLKKLKSKNVRPDFILTSPDTKEIPWGALTFGHLLRNGLTEEKWKTFSNKVKYIIECKPYEPTENDLSQTLWYSLGYKRPLLLIIGERMSNSIRENFEEDIKKLDHEIKIIEEFRIGERKQCSKKIDFL
jgi:hypothetical protein